MQFLVYVTLLMVSISTVLLEVHWLTSPEPRLNPTVQTRAVQAPKTEGSKAGVRTVYPDPSRSLETDSQVQTTDMRQATGQTPETNTAVQPTHLPGPPPASTPQRSPSEQSMPAARVFPQHPLAAPSTQSAAAPQPSAQQSLAETTGAARGEQNSQQQQATLGSSRNRCDILACAGTYRSFRANDCTYQPFDGGGRRLYEKSAGHRLVSEREQPNRDRRTGDAEVRNSDHVAVERRLLDKDEDAVDVDGLVREPTGFLDFIFLGRRSR